MQTLQEKRKLHPLNSYKPRDYQVPILQALDAGWKKVLAIMPRRSGKDITALNYTIRQMWKCPGVYFYIFPTYSQAKKVIWDSITTEGVKMLDYFPRELVIQSNMQEMKIKMRTENGKVSIFQLIGSENIDSLMGTNPRGCVFSEFALQDPGSYRYLRPILTENLGWALFISTPRGKNHLWDLFNLAELSSEWFSYKLTLDETKHIPLKELEKERDEGVMSEDMIQQEYYTSFTMGVEGSYFSRYLEIARKELRIGKVPWESSRRVHTAWDIGVSEATCIIFFQESGTAINIIDSYTSQKVGVDHYAGEVFSKPYLYGTHIAPHDIAVKEWGTGATRYEKARELGLKFTLSPRLSVQDGIEASRTLFSKIWIDEEKCSQLISALESYRQEYDRRKKVYISHPLGDWASHFADAFRYLAISLSKIRMGISPEEIERNYLDCYPNPHPIEKPRSLPSYFRGDL